MSHKNKVCNTALATHIEQCFAGFTYTPLLISGGKGGRRRDVGLVRAIEAEIAADILPKIEDGLASSDQIAEIADKFVSGGAATLDDSDKGRLSKRFSAIRETVSRQLAEAETVERERRRAELIAEVGPTLDVSDLSEALAARSERTFPSRARAEAAKTEFEAKDPSETRPLEHLGMLFSESTCFRPEGFAFAPCGREFTLLPGDRLTEKQTFEESSSSTSSQDGSDTLTQSSESSTTQTDTLSSSYSSEVERSTNFDLTASASVSGKLFGVIDASLSASGSIDFSKILTETAKSSSSLTRLMVDKATRNLEFTRRFSSTTSFTTTSSASFERNLVNETDKPIHFVERQPYCVHTVIHKRTGVNLAWSDCIDDPGRDLCRPGDLETRFASEIADIRARWELAQAPSEFGPRPTNSRICTPSSTWDEALSVFSDNTVFEGWTPGSIPPDGRYVAGSATVEIEASRTDVVSQQILQEPAAGSTGSTNFHVQIVVDTSVIKREEVTFRVCFDVAPAEAADYDVRLAAWRVEQAEAEIAEFLAAQEAELNAFLMSNRVASAIERRIFEDYFGLTTIEDCCALMRRLRAIFNFDELCFTLLPSWNDFGDGCQSTDPVTIYTARCMQFYLPVRTGMEHEALAVLLAINAIPSNPGILAQIGAYINEINDLRDTVFNRAFDPAAGWAAIIDAPNEYSLTTYDTPDGEWNADFESAMNYQLLDAFTVTTPHGGPRFEPRPDIC